jgi:hypothetical protein
MKFNHRHTEMAIGAILQWLSDSQGIEALLKPHE